MYFRVGGGQMGKGMLNFKFLPKSVNLLFLAHLFSANISI